MLVSDRQNISDDIIVDDYKEDNDVIDDERDNPSNWYDARPTANNKKPMMTLMLMLKKKMKKKMKNQRKENIAFRESCDGSASSKNINFSKPHKGVLFPFIKPGRLFHKRSTPPPAAASNADCFPGRGLYRESSRYTIQYNCFFLFKFQLQFFLKATEIRKDIGFKRDWHEHFGSLQC